MSRKIILIKQELLLLVYELNRSGLLAENEKIRPILAQLEKLLLCDLSNFFSDKLVLTSVTPASSAPVLQTPKATSSTLYFDSLTVNAGNGGFLHCIQM